MNKNILLTNIQNFMTSLQLTIGKLDSLVAKDKSYSESQIDKQITLLQVKLQDDNNYNCISSEVDVLNTLIEEVQSEKNVLRNLIGKVGIRNAYLEQKKDKNNSLLSYNQRKIEELAPNLEIAEKAELTLKLINERKDIISKLKEQINVILEEIRINNDSIELYNKKIKELDTKEEEYSKDSDSLSNKVVNINEKNEDIRQLNRFSGIRDLISSINILNAVYFSLQELRDFLKNNRIDTTLVANEVEKMKAKIAIIIRQVMYFINSNNLKELENEKSVINERITSGNGYVLGDSEREMIYDEIASLQLSIALNESDSIFDENVLEEYRVSISKINKEIDHKVNERTIYQTEVNRLVLEKNSFFNEYSQERVDAINKEIKRIQKQIDDIDKKIQKYIKNKTDIESAITFVKKKRKNSESLKEIKVLDLKNIRQNDFSKPTTKYSLNDDKQQLMYIDFIIELVNFGNYLLSQDYIKRLEDIALETIEPFVSVVDFYKYDNLDAIYSGEFMIKARETIGKMLSDEIVKPEDIVSELKSQGISVVKYGKSLKSMEETKEIEKSVRLAA